MPTSELPRTLDQWRDMIPEAVCDGSPAQILYCIRDARQTILAQAREIKRLEKDIQFAGRLVGRRGGITR